MKTRKKRNTKKICQQNVFAKGIRFSSMNNDIELGHAYLYIMNNDLHKEPFGILEDLFVVDAAGGQGIGSELVRQVVAAAKRAGCYKLIETSRTSRPKVHEFYKNLGFEQYGFEFRMDFGESET